MKKTAPAFTKSETAHPTFSSALSVTELERCAQDWLYDGEFRQHSPRTQEFRRHVVKNCCGFCSSEDALNAARQRFASFWPMSVVVTPTQEVAGATLA